MRFNHAIRGGIPRTQQGIQRADQASDKGRQRKDRRRQEASRLTVGQARDRRRQREGDAREPRLRSPDVAEERAHMSFRRERACNIL